MGQHYNAFISYKHAELDNKIAAQIEKDLEHYHIPRKLQKKTGYKRIERIFRDKDELPITSNLSGTIEEALYCAVLKEYLLINLGREGDKALFAESSKGKCSDGTGRGGTSRCDSQDLAGSRS